MSDLRYGDIVRYPCVAGHWTGVILSRSSGARGVGGEPIWSLIVVDDDEEYWHPGDVITIRENEIRFYRLTPGDADA